MIKICYITVIDRVIKYFVTPHINALGDEYEVTIATDFADESSFDNLQKEYKRFQISISRNVNPFNLLKSIIKLKKFFKCQKFDVIQYTGPSTGLICSIAGKKAKIPTRIYCLWGLRFEGFNGFKRKLFKKIEQISCKNSTHIVLDSPSNKAYCIENNILDEKKGYVIGLGSACGVDLHRFDINKKSLFRDEIRKKWNIPSESFVFGFVGRITYEKGLNELLESFKAINEKYCTTKLLIVGFVEKDNGIKQEIYEWSKKSDNVIYCGRQDFPEKYYAAFDVFVFPSYREGYGGGVVQAGAMKVPSIVSNIRSLMDSICQGELGYFFPVKNNIELARIMEYCMNNQSEIKRKSELIYKRVVNNFAEDKWQKNYRDFIDNIS